MVGAESSRRTIEDRLNTLEYQYGRCAPFLAKAAGRVAGLARTGNATACALHQYQQSRNAWRVPGLSSRSDRPNHDLTMPGTTRIEDYERQPYHIRYCCRRSQYESNPVLARYTMLTRHRTFCDQSGDTRTYSTAECITASNNMDAGAHSPEHAHV